ncbi:unnamed protein product [Heligmosomoides polygyrus]|uniref:Major sperm protein n=1 Tax=Heligmosomoides polygyrus TaxID=6339 RepID=A0A183FR43_HELPZ|nr:unnamed protein product [Heligmosomoides polygyrus]
MYIVIAQNAVRKPFHLLATVLMKTRRKRRKRRRRKAQKRRRRKKRWMPLPIIDAAGPDALSSTFVSSLLVKVEPPKARFNTSGGVSMHNVTNKGLNRIVFKIKCSNNNEYGIHPVYGFIEGMSPVPIKITRLPGTPKEDRMVIQWTNATPDMKDPKEAFKSASPWILPLSPWMFG